MDSYVSTFKRYVPAEILAAFIAIRSIISGKEMDVLILAISAAVLTVIFVVYSWKYGQFKSRYLIFAVAATLPFWCFMIAFDDVNERYNVEAFQQVIPALLIIVSVCLTLFAREGAQPEAAQAT